MAMSTPYADSKSGYKGNVTETQDVLDAWVERVHRAGIQVNCHANGDVAIDSVLTAYERAQRTFPRADARPKITHCTLINDDLLRRIKAIGAVPTPFTTYAYYNTDKFHFYGEELMKRAMAYRSFIDAGITAAAGSDFSPGPFAPLMGIQGMVTRTGWNGESWGVNQRVSVEEALQIMTRNGAYASHEEAIKGTITAGKWADFVVLAEDPQTIAQEKIKDIRIYRTVTAGNTVYQGLTNLADHRRYRVQREERHPPALVVLQPVTGGFDFDQAIAPFLRPELDQIRKPARIVLEILEQSFEASLQVRGGNASKGQRQEPRREPAPTHEARVDA